MQTVVVVHVPRGPRRLLNDVDTQVRPQHGHAASEVNSGMMLLIPLHVFQYHISRAEYWLPAGMDSSPVRQ